VTRPPKTKRSPAIVRDSTEVASARKRATAEGGDKKRHSYKLLPKVFRRTGFTYRQIACETDAAIYEQVWNGCHNPSVCYEVIRIRQREAFQIGGRLVEPAELFPTSEAWGVDGFTLIKKDAAFRKFREIADRKAVQ